MVEGEAEKRGVAGWRAAGVTTPMPRAAMASTWPSAPSTPSVDFLSLSLFSLKFWDLSLVSLVFSSSPAAFIVSMPPSLFSSLLFFY
jgi:hypothetical protein